MNDYLTRFNAWLDAMPRWPINHRRKGYQKEVIEHLVAMRRWAEQEPKKESE